MDNEKLIKAVKLKEKIDYKNKVIFTINKLKDKGLTLTDFNCSVVIPKNLREVILTLLNGNYV